MVKKYRDIVKDPILAVQWLGDNVEDLINSNGLHFYMKGRTPILIEEMGEVEVLIGDYIVKFPGEDHWIVAEKDSFELLCEEIKE